MKFIGYAELGNSDGLNLRESLEKCEYKGMDRVVNYLKNERMSNLVCVSTGLPKDIFTGEPIRMQEICLSDGAFAWSNILSYYVKNYYLRMPKEFEEHILKHYKKLD